MSNIVAMALCRIKDSKNLEYNKDTGADNTYTLYSSMCEILCESADRFIPGDWEFEIIPLCLQSRNGWLIFVQQELSRNEVNQQ